MVDDRSFPGGRCGQGIRRPGAGSLAEATQGVQDEKQIMDQLPAILAEKKEITAGYAAVDKAIEQNNTENEQIKAEIDEFNASPSSSDADRAVLNEKREGNLQKAADLKGQEDALDAREKASMEKAADLARQYKAIQAHEKHIFTALAKLKIFKGNVQDCLKLGSDEAIVQCMQSQWDGANANPGGSMVGGPAFPQTAQTPIPPSLTRVMFLLDCRNQWLAKYPIRQRETGFVKVLRLSKTMIGKSRWLGFRTLATRSPIIRA